ncbi:MAG TPA: phosphate acyltransferase PlsX [Dehalococcoidia bacterium]
MLIALDGMGGDHAPAAPVAGALQAVREFGVEVALVGPSAVLEEELARHGPRPSGILIAPASETIGMDEPGAQAARQKRDSSIAVGMTMVKEGAAAAFVSAGNTGACMAAAVMVLGRVPGVDRPALGVAMPTTTGRPTFLLDVGANAEARPGYLVQFAYMGQAYVERAFGVERPRVGLLSIGEEAGKGNQLVQEAHGLLRKQSRLNFIGNVEGKDIVRGVADVVVTDGFTGNVVLKASEGVADLVLGELRWALTSRRRYRLAALAVRSAVLDVRRRLDYAEYGGAPLLGVNGVVAVAHGRSDARAIRSALRMAHQIAQGGLTGAMREALKA